MLAISSRSNPEVRSGTILCSSQKEDAMSLRLICEGEGFSGLVWFSGWSGVSSGSFCKKLRMLSRCPDISMNISGWY